MNPRVFSTSLVATLLSLLLLLSACGGNAGSTQPSPNLITGSTAATARHMVIVVEESKDYSEVVGSPEMPFFNSLVPRGALAGNYFGVANSSLPNYFMLTTGQTLTPDNTSPVVNVDNIVRVLGRNHLTWKVYAEDLPSTGYIFGDIGFYVQHHNPFVFLSDVVNNLVVDNVPERQNVVPFSQFATDLANHALPNYAFIVPNAINDGTLCIFPGCTIADQLIATDQFLRQNLPSLLSSPDFVNGDGLLAIVWDASDVSFTNGGGHVPMLLLGAGVKRGVVSQTIYQHPSLLRLSMRHLLLQPTLGAAGSAPDMSDMVIP